MGTKVNNETFREIAEMLWYLTERECLKLMGFDDSDINKLEEAHPRRKNCTSSKLYKQAGNSIVVDVLMAIIKALM